MDAPLLDTAQHVGRLAARHAKTVAPKPRRWVPFAAALTGVGLLLAFGGPLLRWRPVRKLVKSGADQALSSVALG